MKGDDYLSFIKRILKNVQKKGGTMEKRKAKTLWRMMLTIIISAMLMLTACSDNEYHNSYDIEVEEQTNQFYVNDFAGVFSEEEKQQLMENAVSLAEEYDGIQVVVSTVTSLKGYTIEQYGYAMYNQYKIGNESMGILILLSTEDREVSIETGKNMQAYITDTRSGQLLDDYGMQYFRNNEFAEGLIAVQEATINEIKELVPIDWNTPSKTAQSQSPESNINQEESVNEQQIQVTEQNNSRMGEIDMLFAVLFVVTLIIAIALGRLVYKAKKQLAEVQEGNEKNKNAIHKLLQIVQEYKEKNNTLENDLEKLSNKTKNEIATLKKGNKDLQNSSAEERKMLQSKIKSLEEKNNGLNNQIAEMQEFYARVCKLHPENDFKQEVSDMIAAEFKAAVDEVDSKINSALNLKPSKDNVEKFAEVISFYENASDDVRNAVTANINKVKQLQQEAIKLRQRDEAATEAKKIDKMLEKVLNNKASKENVDIFAKAIQTYENASVLTKNFIKTDMSKIKQLYQESVNLLKKYQKELKRMKDEAEAQLVFEKMEKIFQENCHGEYDEYPKLNDGYKLYRNLTDEQKHFFPDMQMLHEYEATMQKAKEAEEDYYKAQQAEKEIKYIIGHIWGSASENDLRDIKRAFSYYHDLSQAQRMYFNDDLLRKLKHYKDEAESDRDMNERRRREEEEEDERRRSNFYHNNFGGGGTFGGGGSFGGFGGSASGGGASRSF